MNPSSAGHCLIVSLLFPLAPLPGAPLSIAEAEEIAERNSVELRLLRGEQAIAEEGVHSRWRDFFPQLALSYRRNRTVAQRNFDNGAHSVQLSVSQPVFDGGRSLLALEIARLDRRLNAEKYSQARATLRLQVRQDYFRILNDQENARIGRSSLESARRALNRAELELEQGAIPALDEQQLAVEFERRALELERSERSLQESERSLGRLLRTDHGQRLELFGLENFELRFPAPPPDGATLAELALENRSDVRQARIDALRAAREERIQRYDWLPTIALTGNLGRTGEEWPPRTTEWGVGVSFTFRAFGNTLVTDAQENRSRGETSRGYSSSATLNVYDNAGWRATRLRSQLDAMRSREQREQLITDVQAEIEKLRHDFLLRVREVELAERTLDVHGRRFQVDRLKYENGETALQDYLEQELRFVQAQLDAVRQRIDLALAANQLETALGLPLDSLGLVEIRLRSAPARGSGPQ